MPRFVLKLDGLTPLLMHSSRLVDPLDDITSRLAAATSISKKTRAQHEEIAQLEWLGGIYHDPHDGPIVPAANLRKCIIEGARFGKKGKVVERALVFDQLSFALRYDGPRDLERLYADKRFVYRTAVRVQQARVMRTRPSFRVWAVQATGWYDDEQINHSDLTTAVTLAGQRIGLCDGRPTFGRFDGTLEVAA